MVGVRILHWTRVVPVLALVALLATWSAHPPNAVLAAVDHAEVIAHRVGEPFGSLILAIAVTVIEVGLIVMLMTHGGDKDTSTLARDTVFGAAMIACNGIVGVSVLIGALRRGVASFNAEGTATMLATVATL